MKRYIVTYRCITKCHKALQNARVKQRTPGFPAYFFSRKRVCLLLERANAEGEFLFLRRRLTGFTVARPATSLSSLALLGVLAGNLQLTVTDNES